MVHNQIFQLGGSANNNSMLVHFHVRHGSVLVFQAAFVAAFAAPEERKLIKAGTAVAQPTSQEIHLQADVVTVEGGILDSPLYFPREFGREEFVGIHEKNPVIGEWKRVHGPLALLRPASLVVKLYDLGTKRAGDLHSAVGALGIDDVDFADLAQRLQTARQVVSFVAHGNDDAHREKAGQRRTPRLCDLFQFLHSSADRLPSSYPEAGGISSLAGC